MTGNKDKKSFLLIEYLRAWESGAWDTVTVKVPEEAFYKYYYLEEPVLTPINSPEFDQRAVEWALDNLANRDQYSDVVYWGFYAVSKEV